MAIDSVSVSAGVKPANNPLAVICCTHCCRSDSRMARKWVTNSRCSASADGGSPLSPRIVLSSILQTSWESRYMLVATITIMPPMGRRLGDCRTCSRQAKAPATAQDARAGAVVCAQEQNGRNNAPELVIRTDSLRSGMGDGVGHGESNHSHYITIPRQLKRKGLRPSLTFPWTYAIKAQIEYGSCSNNTLIQRGGGTGPVKPRQPVWSLEIGN